MRWSHLALAAKIVAMGSLAPALAQSELPLDLVESVDVRRVNVDVVVTDRLGQPVSGLTRDDFELRIRRDEVEIANFSEVGPGAPALAPPTVVIVIDQRSGEAALRRTLLGDVRANLGSLLEVSSGVMVAELGQRLQVTQPLTQNEGRLREVLVRAGRAISTGQEDGSQLLRQLERARPIVTGDELSNDLTLRQARTLLDEIRAQAREDALKKSRATVELRRLVRALAAQPSRSCVLLLSSGLESTPSEVAFRLWWAKYGEMAAQIGLPGLEADMARFDGTDDVAAVIADAANGRVTFYTLSIGRGTRRGSAAEFTTSGVVAAEQQAIRDPLAVLGELASATGGESALRSGGSGDLLDALIRDVENYYSLAFDPTQVKAKEGRLRVRVRGDGLQVRAARRFTARQSRDELEERLMAALYLGYGDNLHDVAVDVGKPVRAGRGRYEVDLSVRIPASRIVLLPEKERHRGQIELAVAARAASGGTSPTAGGVLPIVIPNENLLRWLGSAAASKLRIGVSDERQTVGVAVRDVVGQTISVVQVAVDPRSGG